MLFNEPNYDRNELNDEWIQNNLRTQWGCHGKFSVSQIRTGKNVGNAIECRIVLYNIVTIFFCSIVEIIFTLENMFWVEIKTVTPFLLFPSISL